MSAFDIFSELKWLWIFWKLNELHVIAVGENKSDHTVGKNFGATASAWNVLPKGLSWFI